MDEFEFECCPHCGCDEGDRVGHDDTCRYGCNDKPEAMKKVPMQLFEVMCLDCEAQWDPNYQPHHCLCDDPADDAWMLFIRDAKGKWVRALAEAIDNRHNLRQASNGFS